jgi:hypothetical protein
MHSQGVPTYSVCVESAAVCLCVDGRKGVCVCVDGWGNVCACLCQGKICSEMGLNKTDPQNGLRRGLTFPSAIEWRGHLSLNSFHWWFRAEILCERTVLASVMCTLWQGCDSRKIKKLRVGDQNPKRKCANEQTGWDRNSQSSPNVINERSLIETSPTLSS